MRPFDYLLYAGVVFAWSTSWYPLSLQMGVVEAEVSLVWRFTAAAVLMFSITAWFSVPLRYGRAEHIRFAMLGIVLFSTNFALYYNASLYAASGLLAVILSTIAGQCADGGGDHPPASPCSAARCGGHRPCWSRTDFSA